MGAAAFDAASTANYQLGVPGIAGSGVNDLTIVNGNLTLAGTLNVAALAGFGAGVYQLFDYTGSLADNGLTLGSLPAGFTYKIDELTPGQVNLDVAAVPEPGTIVLAMISAALLGIGKLRRRKGQTARLGSAHA